MSAFVLKLIKPICSFLSYHQHPRGTCGTRRPAATWRLCRAPHDVGLHPPRVDHGARGGHLGVPVIRPLVSHVEQALPSNRAERLLPLSHGARETPSLQATALRPSPLSNMSAADLTPGPYVVIDKPPIPRTLVFCPRNGRQFTFPRKGLFTTPTRWLCFCRPVIPVAPSFRHRHGTHAAE